MTESVEPPIKKRWYRRIKRRWLVGGFWAITLVSLGLGNIRLISERTRLMKIINAVPLPPSDLKVVNRFARTIQTIQTLNSHQFAWQVRLPAGSAVGVFSTGERIEGGDPAQGLEAAIRLEFREVPDGWLVDAHYFGQTMRTRCGNEGLVDLIRGRWETLIVEQEGRNGPVTIDPSVPVTMLRLSLSPALMAEARVSIASKYQPQSPVLFEFAIEGTGARP